MAYKIDWDKASGRWSISTDDELLPGVPTAQKPSVTYMVDQEFRATDFTDDTKTVPKTYGLLVKWPGEETNTIGSSSFQLDVTEVTLGDNAKAHIAAYPLPEGIKLFSSSSPKLDAITTGSSFGSSTSSPTLSGSSDAGSVSGSSTSTPTSTSDNPSQSPATASATKTPTSFGKLEDGDFYVSDVDAAFSWASCSKSTTSNQSKCTIRDPPSNTGVKAAAGVLGALFLLSLGALLFLLFRARKHKRANNTPIIYEKPKSDDSSRDIESKVLGRTQVALAEIHASTPLRTAHVLDDRAVAARYNAVSQELKDWVLTHFRSGTGMLNGEYESLLAVPKTRVLVIRALAAGGIWRAAGEGECVFSGSVKRVEAEMARILGDAEFNRWRAETYTALEASESVSADAVGAVTQRICTMLAPLADEGTERKSYHSLYPIVESAVNLTLDLEKQQARFIIDVDTQAGATFNSRLMDDVLQEYETSVDRRGASSNPLDGRRVKLVVTPPLVKYGNELAENYDEMTVVVKGKALAR